ncbi:PREDICTED: uncharacterized protein LOC104826977 [Tarenaya hassleriana]|uniref:uncharacterized protein LOC104826977 n=1 Tax=Tarenaya hassleriana TaxID=28532 RepID=UPI00053C3693|nr:PREDICTED: uncharacterized protein LOC104826977 [Tarenaya hassleriana]
MKPKSKAVAVVWLLIYLFLAVKGTSGEKGMEVYEIDYRGPETHNSRPPPENMHGKPPYIHHKSSAADHDHLGGNN